MSSLLSISPLYGWVLLEAVLIGFLCQAEGFHVMGVRKRLFNKAFYEKNFPETLKDKSKKLPELGYPDMGAGQFSQKLSLEDWMDFANAQRAHYNFVENAASTLVYLLVSGLFFPRFTVAAGLAYMVGRVLYGIGYRRGGSRGRKVGVLTLDIAMFALIGGAIYGCFTFAGGLGGLQALLA